ncbi:MAG: FAD-dependent oxidoreductase, partial [Longimicrobiales bacterium]|nr:FAD-dependent oxidoreductase [Longimicrobiales bacterium]
IDTGRGVYLRSEGGRVLFGMDDPEQPAGFEEGMDWEWLERVLTTGAVRFPWWEEMGVDRRGSWWGYYEVTPDHAPLIGFHPQADGWIDVCGFSGHGVMHAPAAGAAVAELATLGASRTVPVEAFGHGRLTGPEPAGEAHIF